MRLSRIFFFLGILTLPLIQLRVGGPLFNISDAFYILSFILFLAGATVMHRNIIEIFIASNPFLYPILLFTMGGFLSFFNSSDLVAGFIIISKYLFIFGFWIPLGTELLSTRKRIETALSLFLVGSLFVVSTVFLDYFFGIGIAQKAVASLPMFQFTVSYVPGGRFGGIIGHPNLLGLFLIASLAPGLWLFARENPVIKIVSAMFIVGIIVTSLISGSRGGFLGLVLGATTFMALEFKKGKRLRAVLAVSALVFLCMVFWGDLTRLLTMIPQSSLERYRAMLNQGILRYQPNLQRLEGLYSAWQLIKQYPLTGIGIENAGPGTAGLATHNTVVKVWTSGGFLAFLGALGFYFISLKKSLKLIKDARDTGKDLLLAKIFFSVMLGWMAFDMFQPELYDRIKWVVTILMLSLLKIRGQERLYSNPQPELNTRS